MYRCQTISRKGRTNQSSGTESPETTRRAPPRNLREGGDIVQTDQMNKHIRQIIIGLILGDGHVSRPNGNSGRSLLDIKGDAKYLLYLEWLHRELTPIGVSPLNPKKGCHQFRFITKTSTEMGKLRQIFYPNGKKIIPTAIDKLLVSSLSLAVWYQDDGHLDCRSKYHYNAVFATHCFTFDECKLLTKAMKTNFGLEVSVNKCTMRGKLYYKLYVTSSSMPKFIQLVKPFIAPCFSYKIRKLV